MIGFALLHISLVPLDHCLEQRVLEGGQPVIPPPTGGQQAVDAGLRVSEAEPGCDMRRTRSCRARLTLSALEVSPSHFEARRQVRQVRQR